MRILAAAGVYFCLGFTLQGCECEEDELKACLEAADANYGCTTVSACYKNHNCCDKEIEQPDGAKASASEAMQLLCTSEYGEGTQPGGVHKTNACK